MNHYEQSVDVFRRRLGLALGCKYTLALATLWVFLWGTLVLLLRATTEIDSEILLWGAAALPVCLGVGVVLARRQMPARGSIRAMLDRQNGLGGMLMAAGEVEVGAWKPEDIRRVPQVRWDSQRAWLLFTVAIAFLVAGFCVPQHFAARGETPLEIGQEVERIKEQVKALKEEGAIDPARADEMQSKLDELKKNSKGHDPAKTLESMNHLEEQAKNKAKEETESALKQTEQLSKAQELNDALRDKKTPQQGGLDPKQRKEAQQELARGVKEATKDNPRFAEMVDPKTIEAMEKGTATTEQLDQLKASIDESKRELGKKVDRLGKAGLIERDKLEQLQQAGKADGKALLQFLADNAGKASVKDLIAGKESSGSGGVSRGPGAADITFGKESPDITARMKEQPLPQGKLDALKESKARGISINTPIKDEPGERPTSGALAGTIGGSGSTQSESVLPRHRSAVERYFERGK